MEKIRLGRTGLLVTKTAFGALPIQRISKADAVKLVRRACEAGINYFDTANMYTDSEEKLGEEHDMGFIAMKGLSGGLLNNAEACYAFMQEHPDVVPIWGIQHEWELDQWLELTERNPRMTPELQAVIDHDRTELSGDFCRSCGYCLPCAAGIDIPQAARMAQLSPSVPQEVKKSWFASQPTALAITARQSSTLRRISCPKGYCALGLAYCSVSTVYMASATALGTGVVAAWSR